MDGIFVSTLGRIFVLSMPLLLLSQAKVHEIAIEPRTHAKIPLPPPVPNKTWEFLSWVDSTYLSGSYVWLSTFEANYEDAELDCMNLWQNYKDVKYYYDMECEPLYLSPYYMTDWNDRRDREEIVALVTNLTNKVTMWVRLGYNPVGDDGIEYCNVLIWKDDEQTYKRDKAPCADKRAILCGCYQQCEHKDFADFINFDKSDYC